MPLKENSEEQTKLLENYFVEANNISVEVRIEKTKGFTLNYKLALPDFGPGTKALLEQLKNEIISDASIKAERLMEPEFMKNLKEKFSLKAKEILDRELGSLDDKDKQIMIGILLQEMLGLGKLEFLLADPQIEEIVINSSKEPVWNYHKKFGWLKTNISIENENQIQNYASIIARRIGKQITVLNPLLDAHLITGDRVNATLFPISSKGNTLTIRKFRRDPWTVTDFISNNTSSVEAMAFIWQAMQYELNVIVSGGTASGKTSLLNVCLPFIQPNQRIVSIEDTRELTLPDFLHWVPLTTREANIEGKGEVEMLDLLLNSLRMRPDRIIVGEVRRQREIEVMFEAMHTGHSVSTTLHANNSEETVQRLINPPINTPEIMLQAVHLNLVMYRNRRTGIRRLTEISEFAPEKRMDRQGEMPP